MKKALLLCALFISAVVYADKVNDLYQQGKTYYNDKQYNSALKYFEWAQKENNNSANYLDMEQLMKNCRTRLNASKSSSNQTETLADTQTETPAVQAPTATGYRALWNDFYATNGGKWRIAWISGQVHGGLTAGMNISAINFRWTALEIGLVNFNMDFIRSFSLDWEPYIRGYLPVSHDGKWALFTSVGPRIKCVNVPYNDQTYHHVGVFVDLGAEFNWVKAGTCSSRIFIRYDGYPSVGMSVDFHSWL